ncbi:MAG: RluA family pseudouridine synthase [Candidatus Omnitrophota bacterium]
MKKRIAILYEDDQLIAFDKPTGLLVIPAPGKKSLTLTERVNRDHDDPRSRRLHPCHRLDRETSGVILYAKGKRNQQVMMDAFREGRVSKEYRAVVKGCPRRLKGEIRARVKDVYQRRRRGAGRMAVTRYEVLDSCAGCSLVRAEPVTGRTNQIRIHFARMGHPLLGERVYAFRRYFTVDMKRLALHAHVLTFPYPGKTKRVVVRSDLPADMVEFWDQIKNS